MKRRGWLVAISLVVLGNLVLLAGVAWNRAGEPDAVIELTERELPMAWSWRDDEDSGLSLRLNWTGGSANYYGYGTSSPSWLDTDKLEELGFDFSVPVNAETAEFHYNKQLPREAYTVLEFDGPAWQNWLAEQERDLEEAAEKVADGEQTEDWLEDRRESFERRKLGESRLFAVDAGTDPDALRERYPDRSRYLIVPAVFRIWASARDVTASVSKVLVDRVHVRRGQRDVFDGLPERRRWRWDEGVDPSPRYKVTLMFGKRLEPWIETVERIEIDDVVRAASTSASR